MKKWKKKSFTQHGVHIFNRLKMQLSSSAGWYTTITRFSGVVNNLSQTRNNLLAKWNNTKFKKSEWGEGRKYFGKATLLQIACQCQAVVNTKKGARLTPKCFLLGCFVPSEWTYCPLLLLFFFSRSYFFFLYYRI